MHAKVKFLLNSRVIDLSRAFIFEIQSWRARLAARGKKRGQNLNSRYTELFFTGTKERERERKTERRRNHVITPTSSSMHRVNKHFFLLCEKEGNKSKKEGEKNFSLQGNERERSTVRDREGEKRKEERKSIDGGEEFTDRLKCQRAKGRTPF